MKYYYLLANGQPGDRAVYYTGKQDFHGGESWGNINDAYKFTSIKDICEFIAKRNDTCASPIIVEIADITFDRCLKGYNDIMMSNYDTDEAKCMRNFNRVSYITNSEKC